MAGKSHTPCPGTPLGDITTMYIPARAMPPQRRPSRLSWPTFVQGSFWDRQVARGAKSSCKACPRRVASQPGMKNDISSPGGLKSDSYFSDPRSTPRPIPTIPAYLGHPSGRTTRPCVLEPTRFGLQGAFSKRCRFLHSSPTSLIYNTSWKK